MPYVTRDASGRIAALSAQPADPSAELLAPSHPEVLDFLFQGAGEMAAAGRFLASDLAFIRVVEDLVAVLVEKRMIAITDLPAPAQDKLLDRRSMRTFLSGVSGVFAEEGEAKII